MREAELLKLEKARDDAAQRMQQALDDRAALEAVWPEHPASAIIEVKRQLERTAACWQAVHDWAEGAIRGDAEREFL